jgi:hypothetical protein
MFSKIEAIDRVLEILTFPLRGKESKINVIEWALASKLQPGNVETSLADLTSVITIALAEDQLRPGNVETSSTSFVSTITIPLAEDRSSFIKFLHASLPAFLLDESRSAKYHISSDHSTRLACNLLELPTKPVRERDRIRLLISVLETASPTKLLYDSLLSYNFTLDPGVNTTNFPVNLCMDFFRHFDRLVR